MAADVVVVGAGVIGAACAYALRRAGLRVLVLERGAPASGTTAAGEGNVLVSDKAPGPELELAVESRRLWPGVLAELGAAERARRADAAGGGPVGGAGSAGGPDVAGAVAGAARVGLAAAPGSAADAVSLAELAGVEWEAKGGLTVATRDPGPLFEFAAAQRAAGVDARVVEDPWELEPHLTRRATGAVHYPEDAQVQPVLVATALLRGIPVRSGVTALGLAPGGVLTSEGVIRCEAVVNACGPWAGEFATAVGAPIRVLPRRGMVLVTGPLPEVVRHKVYDGDYVGAVASGDAALQTSAVVESTRGGTVLIGSSRERVGFDESLRVRVLRELAIKAMALFPVLGEVPVMRAYGGFRPYAPDHLPIIGADPRVPGLWHATGHEGAGIGLAPATGELLADLVLGRAPRVDPRPFRVDRAAVLG
ncbi:MULTISPECIES: FAD-dependent oxidoreductase [unclassified Crossiella]|uniref:NAD(P)/FAD-dependent oxidoreductase n=1 Tax=unclassified Crossiella TaxID=2620835 RepID=UPI001FFF1A6F|nr:MULTISPECIES: FAD-dependent oxidoreductase [unclassified Crossiella]MCK2239498.1 FAD-binding oxidoreductase [Crossiella sp. S99.2]MCK2252193.1 FAD-binding oxidoreductase [Crossiella sp. S99.1]